MMRPYRVLLCKPGVSQRIVTVAWITPRILDTPREYPGRYEQDVYCVAPILSAADYETLAHYETTREGTI